MVAKIPAFLICTCLGLSILPHVRPAHAEELNAGLPTTRLAIGGLTLTLEVATKPKEHSIGLMNRRNMAENEGMLFVFDPPRMVHFWMKNTYIPLSAAFVAPDGTVVKMTDMEPLSEKTHSPDVPVKYVIEVNRGWFKKAGLRVGDAVKIDLQKDEK
jgi:hypothetical protein